MSQNVLVTGGAGYVGSHACKALRTAGYIPVTFDSLSNGWRDAVKFGPLEEGDLSDRSRLDEVFARWKPVAVMHFAALSLVGDAMRDPGTYWRSNVLGSLNLIEAAVAAGCRDFVFSSTCATYGDHDGVVLNEDTPQLPINAYGKSKLAIEQMLGDFGASHGLRSVIFRYFNVAGADPDGEVGEFHRPETHLIPLLLDAIDGRRPALTVYGTDYPTTDGTCVRDYVHVMDLVDAHVKGLAWLADGNDSRVFCLGTGTGFSVREVIDYANRVTNREVPIVFGDRRAGDAVSLVCGSERAKQDLGWRPERSDMANMIADAWRWHQNGGFER
ncbi:MAG: UDP-glucose 4-epimerase GalE [Rhodobacteraceae bacterium]|nr:UDP-glucose 4-epimerase GalE [Paracoccaceae bacterium]